MRSASSEPPAASVCEPFCATAGCDELNGDVEFECGACAPGHACRPGAPGWPTLAHAVAVAPGGQPLLLEPQDEDEYLRRVREWRDADHADPGLQRILCTDGSRTAARDPLPRAGCRRIDHRQLNRSALRAQRTPLFITGLTDGWLAHERWSRSELLARYGSHAFALSPDENVTISRVLSDRRYHLAHAERDGCYHPTHGPYSPFLLSSIAADYAYPEMLQQPSILQMGLGDGDGGGRSGLGVPPESHSSSWLAQIKGSKRWVLHPPSARKPCASLGGGSCELRRWSEETLVCEHEEGEVMWTPEGWWHETCALGAFSIAIGALTTLDGGGSRAPRPCAAGEYTTRDLPFCRTGRCPGLEP